MLVVEYYHFLPGKCAFCHSSNLPTIDTGLDLDWQNNPNDDNPSAVHRVYVCADCAINMAMMVAGSRDIEVNRASTISDLNSQLNAIAATNSQLMQRLNEVEGALTVIKNLSQPKVQIVEQSEDVDMTEFKVATPPPARPKK